MNNMTKVLITGATGNVGTTVINSLMKLSHKLDIYAGVRDVEKDKEALKAYKIKVIPFDFTDISTFKPALTDCGMLFLLRPPQLSDVAIFKPLIETAVECGVKHIVFLSVQGVEKSTIIPHHKIEKLIVKSTLPYTFLRPAYFMQNFTSTLHEDLVKNKRIFLPAGKAKFTLIDVTDIGAVAAKILTETEKHLNKSYELTNNEKLNFSEMAEKLSLGLGEKITYESPNLFKFYFTKRKEGVASMYILVLIMLHYLPRFQKEPAITDCVKQITHHEPKDFDGFVLENKARLR